MRLIDADAYTEKYECCGYLDEISVKRFNEITPTIHAVERKKGKWIGKPIAGYCTVRCSVCKNVFLENNGRWNFCPDCGADMRGEQYAEIH